MKNLSAAIQNTVTMVLAGGEGERLYPLTRDRAKPAVPFAGNMRLIDFSLSNCLNSGLRRVHVLTQYKSDSLNRHIRLGWNIFNPELDEYIEVNPPQLRLASTWYQGTADAIYQNIYTLQRERPRYVLVLSGDHVYGMDYSSLIESHIQTGAALTIVCKPLPVREASRFGVVTADAEGKIHRFEEKPEAPPPTDFSPSFLDTEGYALCSMGVYIFNTDVLVRRVIEDSKLNSSHDFGCDVIPAMIQSGDDVRAYGFWDSKQESLLYWRDIGTLDAYLDVNLELAASSCSDDYTGVLSLYDSEWPFRSYMPSFPPLNILCSDRNSTGGPSGNICNSLVSNGVQIEDAKITRSVIGANVHVGKGAFIKDSVILSNVEIGEDVQIRRAIIDKHNSIPPGSRIGFDRELDGHYFSISEGGVAAVHKKMPLFSQRQQIKWR